ncbi:putative inorganic phosphate cotransporter isoform X2 [Artemia franciscana]|uniref:putative inorganic phosphate cotransporter isoform X2 n=1 Tax=Artemia franciscana TaxID=6661 RepID=UPI0032DA31B4
MDISLVQHEAEINSSTRKGFGQRHLFATLGFLGLATVYMMRVNLSVAIVDMVNSTRTLEENGTEGTCPFPDGPAGETKQVHGEFNWDGPTQGLVLGCFFWGYMSTQIPAGILAEKHGGKLLFGGGIFLTSIFTLITPMAVRISLKFFIAVRVLTGMAEGVTLPAMHSLMASWIPCNERSTLGSFIMAGMQFGTVVALPLSGLLCEVNIDNGWPLVFYIFGLSGLIWFGFWHTKITDSPENHPAISNDEKEYILDHLGMQKRTKGGTPWYAIFTSLPFWAIFVAHCGNNWGFYTLLTELPTYMKSVLHFDIKSNGFLSALPYLMMWIVANVSSWIADYYRHNRETSVTTIRKTCNSVGTFVPGLALICAVYTGCNAVSTVIFLTIAVGSNGATYSGFQVNHIDIAPNYAGILMGLTNCFANICGFLAPYVVGLITTDEGSIEQWQLVFFISAGIYFVSNTFFLVFSSAEDQNWNRIVETHSTSRPRSFGSIETTSKL